jgi:hypothetical protein
MELGTVLHFKSLDYQIRAHEKPHSLHFSIKIKGYRTFHETLDEKNALVLYLQLGYHKGQEVLRH